MTNFFNAFQSNLQGMRFLVFQQAEAFKLLKRDKLWLERLKFSDAMSSLEIPDGWNLVTNELVEPLSRKNEKSVFFWLHRALYHKAFVYTVAPRTKAVVTLPSFPANSWPLLIIEVGEDAEVQIVDDPLMAPSFVGVIVKVAQGAHVKWNGYQHHDDEAITFQHKHFILGERARLDYYHHVVGGLHSYDETLVDLAGDHSEAFSQVVFFGHGTQQQELRVTHMHVGKETKSNMISKGAVQDRAYSSFLGYIQMEPGCSGADGNLEEHNLLLSNTSKIDAVPGLEIGHHDVKAAHAAYMERVDDEKLFYLASRGIPEAEAVRLILEGFFLDAIDRMGNEPLKTRVFDHLLNLLH